LHDQNHNINFRSSNLFRFCYSVRYLLPYPFAGCTDVIAGRCYFNVATTVLPHFTKRFVFKSAVTTLSTMFCILLMNMFLQCVTWQIDWRVVLTSTWSSRLRNSVLFGEVHDKLNGILDVLEF